MEMNDVIAQITVTLTNNGQVQVSGPIDNRMLCYGLLEMAKDVVREFVANQKKPGNLSIVHQPLNGNGG